MEDKKNSRSKIFENLHSFRGAGGSIVFPTFPTLKR